MTAPAFPAPLPAFRQLARPCQAPGCPNVLSVADHGGLCLACQHEQEQARRGKIKSLDVCVRCHSDPKKPGERYCVRCMSKLNHAYYVRRKAQMDRAARTS